MNYSKQQIRNFRAYEEVRREGRYNMFDPNAMRATGLSKDDYMFVLKNYSALKEAEEAANADDMLLKQTDHS